MRLALRLGLAALLALVALGVGRAVPPVLNQPPPPPPTEAWARAALDRVVALARAGDFERLCGLSDGNCHIILEQAGEDAVPPDPPTVYGTRVMVPVPLSDGAWQGGGVVLEVCGIDGRGQPYRSEVLAFDDGHAIRLINPIYWSGVTIAAFAGAQPAPSVAVSGGASPAPPGCPGS